MTAPATVSTQDRLISYAVIAAVVVFGWWFLFGRGPGEPSTPQRRTAASYVDEFGGDVGKYEAILRYTDCATLSRTFSAGKANFDENAPGGRDLWRGQMAVADDRMDALGCP